MTISDLIEVPANVARAVRERWPHTGNDWAAQVREDLGQLCDRYQAKPVQVLPARYGFVVATTTPDGPLVMRASADPAGPDQAAVAAALADLEVAPRVHEVNITSHATWTVQDQVIPGTPLYALEFTTPPVDALAAILHPMIRRDAPATLPRLSSWLRGRLLDDNLTDTAPSLGPVSPAVRQEALQTLDSLATDPADHGLCHGDTSWGNILQGADGRLSLIDPRGMTGDVAYDAAVVALKSAAHASPTDIAERLATTAGLDPHRVRGWLTVARAARV